ncbi:MAG: SulP family inorganic anion transporter [Rhodomicrobium sp.]
MALVNLRKTVPRPGRFLPLPTWLSKVSRRTLPADLLAGLTGAIIVLPQGVAFATIAGMPPEYGLYAAIVPTIAAALFGSSWHLVAGPSTTASLVLATALSAFAEPGSAQYVKFAITLAFMVGLLELALGLFRLGALVNFVSHSVIVGFTAGVGILIILTQIHNFVGLAVPQGLPVYALVAYLAAHIGSFDTATTLTGAIALATGLAVRHYLPRVPFMIVAISAGCAAGAAFNAAGAHVATVGMLPSRLPPLSAPSFDPSVWAMLLPTALALAISALNESVSISRALAIRTGQHIDANQEFIGQGMANTLGSFFSGYVVSSSFNRSALNYAVGAQTPVSALTAGLSLAAIISVAAPLAVYLPYSAMAASLFLIGWSLIDRANIAQIARTSSTETYILIATLFAALFIQVQVAILAGVVLSLVVYLYRTSNPRIVRRVPDPASPSRKMTEPRPDLPECPQFHIIRFNGSLFFGAVSTFKEELLRCGQLNPSCRHLAIIMTGVNFADIAGAEALAQMARHYRERDGCLYLIGLNSTVADLLEKGRYLDVIGKQNVFRSKTAAFRYIYTRLDYDHCRGCNLRVFVECARMGKQEPSVQEAEEVV